ncbi:MAG: alkaline phosphatase family protein [Planctomycetota bacterium]|jgi:predicted AlkP superfamily pyrophosphatase or phosphodiesterase
MKTVSHVGTVVTMVLILLTVGVLGHAGEQDRSRVRLVVQITIDGLRGDLINRYSSGFGDGGFKYLMQNGVVYTNAHYQHANTETIVGHTTLATGAFPSVHGMVGNVWFDDETGELSYNIEDAEHPILPTRKDPVKGEQLDPSQKISRTKGRSPSVILAATFSDTLAAYYGGRSKIFGVSCKDRGAVAMAGHTGKAFWYSTDTGDFVTSTYYYDAYPQWTHRWNAQRKAESYSGKAWTLLNDRSRYVLGHQDDRPYEVDLKGYGRIFPHPFGKLDNPLFYTLLVISPVGDRLTLDFSKALIRNEKLGADEIPDYLAVSFSGVDAVNHFFGPSSLENEDVVVQLDRTLADLFEFVDEQVGLDNTLIVLSSDHGMADMPEYMTELGLEAGRLYPDDVIRIANEVGKQQFGIDGLVRFFFRPSLYLDHAKINAAKLDREVVERATAAALTDSRGISLAVSRSGLPSMQKTAVVAQIRRNFHPSRSGDIYVVQDPYWFMFEKGPIAAMHGSPWRYDTHVPIIFAGVRARPQQIHRLVHPVDVAPTLAALSGMTPPSCTNGSPLEEVLIKPINFHLKTRNSASYDDLNMRRN